MRCDRVRRRLNAFADDELDRLPAARVAGHLSHCPGCATELAQIRRLGAAAAALWSDAAAPATLRARLAAALWASSDERCGEDDSSEQPSLRELLALLERKGNRE